jgi:predicted DNA-binding transcriptional regulator AlpA
MKKKPHGQPDLYSPLIYRISTLARILGVSRFTFYRWVRKGIFPKPTSLEPNSSKWVADEVHAWVDARRAETNNGSKK